MLLLWLYLPQFFDTGLIHVLDNSIVYLQEKGIKINQSLLFVPGINPSPLPILQANLTFPNISPGPLDNGG